MENNKNFKVTRKFNFFTIQKKKKKKKKKNIFKI
jgi:hypothetical protein